MMEDIKEIVTNVLDQKGVLARMKAELRANVFLAIDEQEKHKGTGIAAKTVTRNRQLLMESKEGRMLAELVREFLAWCNLHFTIKVYEPEMQCAETERQHLSAELGMEGLSGDQPLLLAILQRFFAADSEAGPAATAPQIAAPAVIAAERSELAAAAASPAPSTHGPAQATWGALEQVPAAANAATAAPAAATGSPVRPLYSAVVKKGATEPERSDDVESEELIGVEVQGQHSQDQEEEEEEHYHNYAKRVPAFEGAHEEAGADDDSGSSTASPPARPLRPQALSQPIVQAGLQGTATAAATRDNQQPSGHAALSSPTGSASDAHSTAASSDVSPSISPSSAGLKPLAKLEPLPALRGGKLGALPALKPVAAISKEDQLLPTGGPSPPGRPSLKSSEEVKEELRRAGLIADTPTSPPAAQSADSQGQGSAASSAASSQLPAGAAAAAAGGAAVRGGVLRGALHSDSDTDSDISTESFPEEELELELPMGQEGKRDRNEQTLQGSRSSVFGDGHSAARALAKGGPGGMSLDFHDSGFVASDRSGDFERLQVTPSGGAAYIKRADDDTDSTSSDDDF